jgi:hypothetical protein
MRNFLALSGVLAALVFCQACNRVTPPAQNSNTPSNVASNANVGQTNKGDPSVNVWVNTPSKVYHCPGTRLYGQTKTGGYMTQKEALDKGNRPATGKYCQ